MIDYWRHFYAFDVGRCYNIVLYVGFGKDRTTTSVCTTTTVSGQGEPIEPAWDSLTVHLSLKLIIGL